MQSEVTGTPAVSGTQRPSKCAYNQRPAQRHRRTSQNSRQTYNNKQLYQLQFTIHSLRIPRVTSLHDLVSASKGR